MLLATLGLPLGSKDYMMTPAANICFVFRAVGVCMLLVKCQGHCARKCCAGHLSKHCVLSGCFKLGRMSAVMHDIRLCCFAAGVDVFCIAPGALDTPMFQASSLNHLSEVQRAELVGKLGQARLIPPREIAEQIAFLCRCTYFS